MNHQLSLLDDKIKARLKKMRIKLTQVSLDKYLETNDPKHLESALRELRKLRSYVS